MKDDHLPAPDQWCSECLTRGDHCWCKPTDLDIRVIGPLFALHDAALAVTGERP